MPVRLPEALVQGRKNEFVSGVHPSGNALLLGSAPGWASWHDFAWHPPDDTLAIEGFRLLEPTVQYYPFRGGQGLLIAMPSGRKKADLDLFVSIRQCDGRYGAPVHLGTRVNTRGHDYAPFLAPDGQTLYFTTDGPRHHARRSRLYKAQRLDSTWQNWSEPEWLPSNRPPQEWVHDAYPHVAPDGQTLYFASTRTRGRDFDLFTYTLPPEARPKPYTQWCFRLMEKSVMRPLPNHPVRVGTDTLCTDDHSELGLSLPLTACQSAVMVEPQGYLPTHVSLPTVPHSLQCRVRPFTVLVVEPQP
jgi:hypothetical protein